MGSSALTSSPLCYRCISADSILETANSSTSDDPPSATDIADEALRAKLSINDLPDEILIEISGHIVDASTLANLCLVSRRWARATSPSLYRTVGLDLGDKDCSLWHDVAICDRRRFHVHHINFKPTVTEVRQIPDVLDFIRLSFPAGSTTFRGHFPNIRSLNLTLPPYAGRARMLMWRELWTAIMGICAVSPLSLTVSNIRLKEVDDAGRQIFSLSKMTDTITPRKIKRLHLYLVGVSWSHLSFTPNPGAQFTVVSSRLKTNWLSPQSAHLTHLSLYCRSYLGVFPYLDFRELDFPCLKSLALGNYCFGVSRQLDSILRYKTIETLLLDDCPILFVLTLLRDPPHAFDPIANESNWTQCFTTFGGSRRVYNNKDTWATYFDKITNGLPQLRYFGFRPGNWDVTGAQDVPQAFEDHSKLGINAHPQSRYVAFSAATGEWLEILTEECWDSADRPFASVDLDDDFNKRLKSMIYDMCDDELPKFPYVTATMTKADNEALERLLKVLESRTRTIAPDN